MRELWMVTGGGRLQMREFRMVAGGGRLVML
jgi:hypothetical protein